MCLTSYKFQSLILLKASWWQQRKAEAFSSVAMLCKQATQDGSMHRGGVQRAGSGLQKVPGNREGEKSYPHTRRNMLENQGRCLSQNVQDVGSQGRWEV